MFKSKDLREILKNASKRLADSKVKTLQIVKPSNLSSATECDETNIKPKTKEVFSASNFDKPNSKLQAKEVLSVSKIDELNISKTKETISAFTTVSSATNTRSFTASTSDIASVTSETPNASIPASEVDLTIGTPEKILRIDEISPLFCEFALFEKVVLITNQHYYPYVEHLQDILVEVIESDGTVIEVIQKHMQFQPKKTLWLAPTGIFNVVKTECSTLCLDCPIPLYTIKLSDNVLDRTEDFIKEFNTASALTRNFANNILPLGSTFLYLPPIPPSILIMESNDHLSYHNLLKEHNLLLTKRIDAYRLINMFTELSLEIISSFRIAVAGMKLPKEPLYIYELFAKRWCYYAHPTTFDLLMQDQEMVSFKLNAWLSAVKSVIYACIKVTERCFLSELRPTCNRFKDNNRILINIDTSSSKEMNEYNQVVVIGCKEHLNLIQVEEQFSKNISLMNIKYGREWEVNWENSHTQTLCNVKNILFIYIANIKVLAKGFNNCQCSENCNVSSCLVDELDFDDVVVKKRMNKIYWFLSILEKQFPQSTFVLTPLLSSKCIMKSDFELSEDKLLHQSTDLLEHHYLVEGRKEKWNTTTKMFSNIWDISVKTTLHDQVDQLRCDLLRFLTFKAPIEWVESTHSANTNENQMNRSLITTLVNSACSFVQPQKPFPESLTEALTAKIFEKVVIITTPEYITYFKKFENPNVLIITISSKSVDNIPSLVKYQSELMPTETLWLTHTELFKILQLKQHEKCLKCPKHLKVLVPSDDLKMDNTAGLQCRIEALITKVEDSIPEKGSSFAVLPPFPPTSLVLDENKHELYHEIDKKGKMYFFTYLDSLIEYESPITVVSKQITSFLLTKYKKSNIVRQPIAKYLEKVNSWSSYLDVVTYEDVIGSPKEIVSEKFSQWFEHINNFLQSNLSMEISQETFSILPPIDEGENFKSNIPSTVPETEAGPRSPVHEVENSKTNIVIENSSTAFSTTSVMSSELQLPAKHHDHVVVICFCEQDLQSFDGEVSNDMIFLMVNNLDWREVHDKVAYIDDAKKILFIIVGSIYLFSIRSIRLLCEQEKCVDPMYILSSNSINIKPIVSEIISGLDRFKFYLQLNFKGSDIILFPLLPPKCISKNIIDEFSSHETAHALLNIEKLHILKRGNWTEVVDQFKKLWNIEMYRGYLSYFPRKFVDFKRILEQYKILFVHSILWIQQPYTTQEIQHNEMCKLLLRDFIELTCPSFAKFENNAWSLSRFCEKILLSDLNSGSTEMSHAIENVLEVADSNLNNETSSSSHSHVVDSPWNIATSSTMSTIYPIQNDVSDPNYLDETMKEISKENNKKISDADYKYATVKEIPSENNGIDMQSSTNCLDYNTFEGDSATINDSIPNMCAMQYSQSGTQDSEYPAYNYRYNVPSSSCAESSSLSRDNQSSNPDQRRFSQHPNRRSRSISRKKESNRKSPHAVRKQSHSHRRQRSRSRTRRGRKRRHSRSRSRNRRSRVRHTRHSTSRRSSSSSSSSSSRSSSRSSSSPSKMGKSKSRSKSYNKSSQSNVSSKCGILSRPSVKQSSEADAPPEILDETIDKFSVSDSFDFLEHVCNKTDILDPYAVYLIHDIKSELKNNASRAISKLNKKENVFIFRCLADNLKDFSQSCASTEMSVILRAVETITRLIDYIENVPQSKININLEAIAIASMNKSSDFTVGLIKSAFKYVGRKNPSEKDIKEAFMLISKLKCERICCDSKEI